MSKSGKSHENCEARKRIARNVKRNLRLSIIFLIIINLGLFFNVGQNLWPGWLINYRPLIIGIMAFALLIVLFLSPVIVQISSDPQHTSAPKKIHWQGW